MFFLFVYFFFQIFQNNNQAFSMIFKFATCDSELTYSCSPGHVVSL